MDNHYLRNKISEWEREILGQNRHGGQQQRDRLTALSRERHSYKPCDAHFGEIGCALRTQAALKAKD